VTRKVDLQSDIQETDEHALSLPSAVRHALYTSGVDADRFEAVIEAFGPLPIEGRVELAQRVLDARSQYLAHRMWVCDKDNRPAVLRSRLNDIGCAANHLLRLLHRDDREPQPWNAHPAAALALPHLCRASSAQSPRQVWDPPQGLRLLGDMLADLAKAGAQADEIFPARFEKKRGCERRKGPTPATALVERLIDIYATMRAQYPQSGDPPSFGASLIKYVRVGLTFATSSRPVWVDGIWRPSFEAAYMEHDLPKPSRLTNAAIRGVLQRLWSAQTKVE
jgi:hypothetical protein